MTARATLAAVGIALGAAAPARADDPQPAPETEVAPDAPDPRLEAMQAQLDELVARDRKQAKELRRLAHRQDSTRRRVDDLAPAAQMITAYIDAGFFAVGGDGSGVRADLGHHVFAQYDGLVRGDWVLMGDPLSTAVNSRGEPADLGASRALTDDAIDSRGEPGFIANAIGLRLAREITNGVSIAAHVELLPRGHDSRVAIETARIEYVPAGSGHLAILAGKIDSVLGVEYRTQDAPDRLTVTPSLVCRYTCGRPIGVQARYDDGRLAGAVSVTSGDSFQAGFMPEERVVSSTLPTVSARAGYTIGGAGGPHVGVGVSGAIGPQDRQSDDDLTQWHVGADARLRGFHDLDVTAEWVQGRLPGAGYMDGSPGDPRCGGTECLRYKAAYGLVSWRATQVVQPYVRIDWRDALHEHGADFVYVSKAVRATAGVRLAIGRYITAKLEYTSNQELGPIPDFANDVLTTSVVVSSD